MERHFDQELERLKEMLLTMASHAELAVTNALRALTERNDDLARKVKEDDSILDTFEKEIDDAAIGMLALKAPLASDLRLVTVAMKISRDLERVGDEATTIARRALELNTEPHLRTRIDLPAMAAMGLSMLHESIDSFVRRDPARARAIIPRDKEVDAINRRLQAELARSILENPATTMRALHLMVVSKSLERIADHATNIAEDVVFLHEARDIRHASPPAR